MTKFRTRRLAVISATALALAGCSSAEPEYSLIDPVRDTADEVAQAANALGAPVTIDMLDVAAATTRAAGYEIALYRDAGSGFVMVRGDFFQIQDKVKATSSAFCVGIAEGAAVVRPCGDAELTQASTAPSPSLTTITLELMFDANTDKGTDDVHTDDALLGAAASAAQTHLPAGYNVRFEEGSADPTDGKIVISRTGSADAAVCVQRSAEFSYAEAFVCRAD